MIINEARKILAWEVRVTMRSVWMTAATFIAVAGFVSPIQAQQAETTLPCDKREVRYGPADPSLGRNITFSEVKGFPAVTAPSSKKRSPQGTRYALLQNPDFSKPGPWTTTVFIGGAGLNGRVLKLTFTDHENGGVQVQWVNDKLLFMDVWWGRFLSTDLILDVNSKTFLYREDAEYSDMGRPCR